MKYCLLSIGCVITMLLCAGKLHAQEELDSITQATFNEGKLLFKLFYTQSVGAAFMRDKFMDKIENHRFCYFPYEADERYKFILLNLDQTPKVILSFSFSKDFDGKKMIIDGKERSLTPKEARLYQVYKLAQEQTRHDPFFVVYEDSQMHLQVMPTLYGYKAFYFPTADNDTDLIIGNDYAIEFDSLASISSKKVLHTTLTGMKNADRNLNIPDTGYVFNPFTGTEKELVATDVAMAMLYHMAGNYRDYFLVNQSTLYIFDCIDETIEVWNAAKFYMAHKKKRYKGKYDVDKMATDKNGHFQLDPTRNNTL